MFTNRASSGKVINNTQGGQIKSDATGRSNKQKKTKSQGKSGGGGKGILKNLSLSFRSKKGNKREQKRDLFNTTENESVSDVNSVYSNESSNAVEQQIPPETRATYRDQVSIDSGPIEAISDSSSEFTTDERNETTTNKSGYFQALRTYKPEQEHQYQKNGFTVQTSYQHLQQTTVESHQYQTTESVEYARQFQSEDIFKGGYKPAVGEKTHTPDNNMGFLRRKSSSKEKQLKREDSDSHSQTTTTSRSRSDSAESIKRKWTLKSPKGKRKKEEIAEISDAELVYSTYSATNIEHIEGTLQRKPRSPPPTEMEFFDKPVSQVPVQNSTQAYQEIRAEDMTALKDLLKTLSDSNENYLSSDPVKFSDVPVTDTPTRLKTPPATPKDILENIPEWQRNLVLDDKSKTKEEKENVRKSEVLEDARLLDKLLAIEKEGASSVSNGGGVAVSEDIQATVVTQVENENCAIIFMEENNNTMTTTTSQTTDGTDRFLDEHDSIKSMLKAISERSIDTVPQQHQHQQTSVEDDDNDEEIIAEVRQQDQHAAIEFPDEMFDDAKEDEQHEVGRGVNKTMEHRQSNKVYPLVMLKRQMSEGATMVQSPTSPKSPNILFKQMTYDYGTPTESEVTLERKLSFDDTTQHDASSYSNNKQSVTIQQQPKKPATISIRLGGGSGTKINQTSILKTTSTTSCSVTQKAKSTAKPVKISVRVNSKSSTHQTAHHEKKPTTTPQNTVDYGYAQQEEQTGELNAQNLRQLETEANADDGESQRASTVYSECDEFDSVGKLRLQSVQFTAEEILNMESKVLSLARSTGIKEEPEEEYTENKAIQVSAVNSAARTPSPNKEDRSTQVPIMSKKLVDGIDKSTQLSESDEEDESETKQNETPVNVEQFASATTDSVLSGAFENIGEISKALSSSKCREDEPIQTSDDDTKLVIPAHQETPEWGEDKPLQTSEDTDVIIPVQQDTVECEIDFDAFMDEEPLPEEDGGQVDDDGNLSERKVFCMEKLNKEIELTKKLETTSKPKNVTLPLVNEDQEIVAVLKTDDYASACADINPRIEKEIEDRDERIRRLLQLGRSKTEDDEKEHEIIPTNQGEVESLPTNQTESYGAITLTIQKGQDEDEDEIIPTNQEQVESLPTNKEKVESSSAIQTTSYGAIRLTIQDGGEVSRRDVLIKSLLDKMSTQHVPLTLVKDPEEKVVRIAVSPSFDRADEDDDEDERQYSDVESTSDLDMIDGDFSLDNDDESERKEHEDTKVSKIAFAIMTKYRSLDVLDQGEEEGSYHDEIDVPTYHNQTPLQKSPTPPLVLPRPTRQLQDDDVITSEAVGVVESGIDLPSLDDSKSQSKPPKVSAVKSVSVEECVLHGGLMGDVEFDDEEIISDEEQKLVRNNFFDNVNPKETVSQTASPVEFQADLTVLVESNEVKREVKVVSPPLMHHSVSPTTMEVIVTSSTPEPQMEKEEAPAAVEEEEESELVRKDSKTFRKRPRLSPSESDADNLKHNIRKSIEVDDRIEILQQDSAGQHVSSSGLPTTPQIQSTGDYTVTTFESTEIKQQSTGDYKVTTFESTETKQQHTTETYGTVNIQTIRTTGHSKSINISSSSTTVSRSQEPPVEYDFDATVVENEESSISDVDAIDGNCMGCVRVEDAEILIPDFDDTNTIETAYEATEQYTIPAIDDTTANDVINEDVLQCQKVDDVETIPDFDVNCTAEVRVPAEECPTPSTVYTANEAIDEDVVKCRDVGDVETIPDVNLGAGTNGTPTTNDDNNNFADILTESHDQLVHQLDESGTANERIVDDEYNSACYDINPRLEREISDRERRIRDLLNRGNQSQDRSDDGNQSQDEELIEVSTSRDVCSEPVTNFMEAESTELRFKPVEVSLTVNNGSTPQQQSTKPSKIRISSNNPSLSDSTSSLKDYQQQQQENVTAPRMRISTSTETINNQRATLTVVRGNETKRLIPESYEIPHNTYTGASFQLGPIINTEKLNVPSSPTSTQPLNNDEAVTLEIRGDRLIEKPDSQKYEDSNRYHQVPVTMSSVKNRRQQNITLELRSAGPLIGPQSPLLTHSIEVHQSSRTTKTTTTTSSYEDTFRQNGDLGPVVLVMNNKDGGVERAERAEADDELLELRRKHLPSTDL